jgi:hypothetical protein
VSVDPTVIAVAGSLGGVAIGWAGTLFSEKKRDERQLEREKAARGDERMALVVDRRETFELDSLRDLYEALSQMGRLSYQAHALDVAEARSKGGVFENVELDAALDQGIGLSHGRVHASTALILDDALQTQVNLAHEHLTEASYMPHSSLPQAELAFNRATAEMLAAQKAVADRIRELYQGPVTKR